MLGSGAQAGGARGQAVGWLLLVGLVLGGGAEAQRMTEREKIDLILRSTEPLPAARGDRLPFYHWHLTGLGTDDDQEARELLRQLDARGLAVVGVWRPTGREDALAKALRIARLQRELGLTVGINANACSYSFFNDDAATLHVDEAGRTFHDESFPGRRKMGCTFALEHRIEPMAEQMTWWLDRYREAGLPVDFIFYDWEIDGPIEWNGAWEASRRCVRCRQQLRDIDDFHSFQDQLREIRSRLQRIVLAETVLTRFPRALVGNYGVYPHNGERYWYDYFEQLPAGAPYRADQGAKYRRWYHEFPASGYTFAMPVVYTWHDTWHWYDFAPGDYRWFYNMLLVASNAGGHTPSTVPLITFIHWHTTAPPAERDPAVQQMSGEAYQELLWHLLLRGHDTFFIWCPNDEIEAETRWAHPVYAESMRYSRFIQRGVPITFRVPSSPGSVISGLRLGQEVLVRRTDFASMPGPLTLTVNGRRLVVPKRDGECQILTLGR